MQTRPRLQITYNPNTQLSASLMRLRACLGKQFALEFLPIGVGGEKRKATLEEKGKEKVAVKETKKRKVEEEEEKAKRKAPSQIVKFLKLLLEGEEVEVTEAPPSYPFFTLPVEVLEKIILREPDLAWVKDIFNWYQINRAFRKFFQDENGSFEKTLCLKFLGASHTRSREERRLGREPDALMRYRWVLQFLAGEKKNYNPEILQQMADENIAAYKADKSAKIPAWPWYFLRFLSNWHLQRSMAQPLNTGRDAYAATLIYTMFPGEIKHDSPIVNAYDRFVGTWGKWAMGSRFIRESGSAGADLVAIPLDIIYQRAIKHVSVIKPVVGQGENTIIRIQIVEPEDLDPGSIKDASLYTKEVAFTGLDKMVEKPPFDITFYLDLRMKEVFLPKRTIEILQRLSFYLGSVGKHLRVEGINFSGVHLEGKTDRSLNLKQLSDLKSFSFGPSNLGEAPSLPCPASVLETLRLEAAPGDTLEMSLPGDFDCYPKLKTIYLNGNIPIWKPLVLSSILHLYSLKEIDIRNFAGSKGNLLSLTEAIANIKRTSPTDLVKVHISFKDRSRILSEEVQKDYLLGRGLSVKKYSEED